MSYQRVVSTSLQVLWALVLVGTAAAAHSQALHQARGPYLQVTGPDSSEQHFPLKSSHAQVVLNGKSAAVTLTQVFRNRGTEVINAAYIFPGSTQAAVNGMVMTIGDRRIVATIKEKTKARATFEKAKAAGKNASLLAQKTPSVFSMQVANIMPGDEIEVTLSYTEILQAEAGEYAFVLPGVTGPRFADAATLPATETAWIANPYLSQASLTEDPVRYVIDLEIQSPVAIHKLQSPTHRTSVDWLNRHHAKIYLDGNAKTVGNRDFILNYYLQDKKILSGLTQYTWQGENYFMLVAEPPSHIAPAQINDREYLFVVDVSGSMNGFPLEVSRQVMRQLLAGMRPTDRFNILFFAGGSQTLSPVPLAVNRKNIQRGLRMLRGMQGSGGTQLYAAMQSALTMPRAKGMARSIIVISDGYITAEDAVFKLIDNNLDNSNVFAFGIGSSVNRHLIEGIAKAGQAESFVVTSNSEAKKIARRFVDYVSAPLLTNITLTSPNAEIYDLAQTRIPDMLGERPILVLGKYRTHDHKTAKLVLSGTSAGGEKQWAFDTQQAAADKNLPQLWARKRLASLYVVPRDTQNATQSAITALGLQYNLLTQFTSFIAVDEDVRHTQGSAKQVKQPLPLPQGVSNYALGHPMPEPEILWLLLMLMLLLAYRQFSAGTHEST